MKNGAKFLLLCCVACLALCFSNFDVRIRNAAAPLQQYQIAEHTYRLQNEAQVDRLVELGFDVEPLYKTSQEWLDYFENNKVAADGNIKYHNYTELTEVLQNVTSRCSEISKLFSIGQSVQGRELWVIHFSVKSTQQKPAFKYVGNMHGDETVGREMLLELASYICDKYYGWEEASETRRIRAYLDKADIYLLPSMNPDGYELKQRYNANGVDLNRNFPDQYTNNNDTLAGRQPETIAIMKWLERHNRAQGNHTKLVLSANMHGGAQVANYPYDGLPNGAQSQGTPNICPDNITFRYLSFVYAQRNPDMFMNKDFTDGITNGANWYTLYGGMQDYNYVYHQCFEITLELSNVKNPPEGTLQDFWNNNLEAMLAYMEQIFVGINGTVIDKQTQAPLNATISVEGIAYDVTTNVITGSFYRLLAVEPTSLNATAEYKVTVSAPGYENQTFTVTVTKEQKTYTTLHVALEPVKKLPFGVIIAIIAAVLVASLMCGLCFAIVFKFGPRLIDLIRGKRPEYQQTD